MRIVYIGLKPLKADNVAGTGLTWKRGDIHEVIDEKKSAKLLEHPLVWANADEKYELTAEPKMVPPEPRISVVPQETAGYWEPFIVPVTAEVFAKAQKKELIPVFMSIEDADAFSEWKLERDALPDTSPKNTGPTPEKVDKRTREYKAGLEKRSA